MPIRNDTQIDRLPLHDTHKPHEPNYPTQGAESDRLRMRANWLSAVAVLALLLIGGWAENGLISAMRDSQDCYRPGSSNCAGIYIPARSALTHIS